MADFKGKKISKVGSGQSSIVYLYKSKLTYFTKKTFINYDKSLITKEFKLRSLIPNSNSNLGEIHQMEKSILSKKIKLIMPFYPVSLTDFLKTQPVLKTKLYIFKQILNGVKTIHDQGICHRDLKIDNIMMDKNGIIKIIDFGGLEFNDKVLGIHGTDPFLSPQTKNLKYDGIKNDIWSLGIIFFILINNLGVNCDNTRDINLKGSNKFNKFINYPWKNFHDINFKLYELIEIQLEDDILDNKESDLVKEFEESLKSSSIPLSTSDINIVKPSFNSFKKLTLKLKAEVENLNDYQLGPFKLFQQCESFPEGWETLIGLLSLNEELRWEINETLNQSWLSDSSWDEKDLNQFNKLITKKFENLN